MRRQLSRRSLLIAAAAGGTTGLVSALGGDDDLGNLTGGDMALSQAYNVAENLWIGPDSAKSNVSADSGRVYVASDTQVDYYGDAGTWQKMGVGSSSEPVPSVTTGDISNNNETIIFAGNKGGADADARLDSALSEVSDGDIIYLEAAEYSDARTSSKSNALPNTELYIIGMGGRGNTTSTVLSGDWDIQGSQSVLSHCRIEATVTFTNGYSNCRDCAVAGGTVVADDNRCMFYGLGGGGTVQFNSGSGDGEAGVLSGDLTVTDNGSNNILTT